MTTPKGSVSTELTTVHEALQAAMLKGEKAADARISIRVDGDTKTLADDICLRHGTTISAFLRECVNGLVHDYGGATQ